MTEQTTDALFAQLEHKIREQYTRMLTDGDSVHRLSGKGVEVVISYLKWVRDMHEHPVDDVLRAAISMMATLTVHLLSGISATKGDEVQARLEMLDFVVGGVFGLASDNFKNGVNLQTPGASTTLIETEKLN